MDRHQTDSHKGDGKVERVPLGRTGIEVSSVGLGTWQWGDKLFWDYGKDGFKDADLHETFEAAVDAGVDFIDTAEMYGRGRSETLVGEAVRAADAAVVVATKFIPFPWRLRRKSLVDALRKSLDRLEMDSVGLYMVHVPLPPLSAETWADALADAVDAGLTRAVGVSNYDRRRMRRTHRVLARRGIPLASNQVEYSLLHREPERSGLLDDCRKMGVTLVAYSPLRQGLLSGKYSPENPPRGIRGRRYVRELAKVQPLVRVMKEIGDAHGGKTPSQVALNWVVSKGAVPIPGAKNARQARANAGALGWRLTAGEVKALDEASDRVA